MNFVGQYTLKGDQVRYYSALYRLNLLISWCQSSAFICGLMNLCSFARHHRPHMLCNDIGWQEQSMWELKMLAGCHTCLMWITDSAGADKQKTSTMTLQRPCSHAEPHQRAHCPPPLVTAAPWAPDESEQRQLTDRVGELTTAGHLWPIDDQSTSSHW